MQFSSYVFRLNGAIALAQWRLPQWGLEIVWQYSRLPDGFARSDDNRWRSLATFQNASEHTLIVRVGRMVTKIARKRTRKKCLVIPGDGDPCPRCGELHEELPSQPFFTRWFCCLNKACKTTLVMPARYKVVV